MIKDQLFKRLFIPLAGLCFPLATGLVRLRSDSFTRSFLGFCFYTCMVFLAWTGVVRLTAKLRRLPLLQKHIFSKLVVLSLAAAFYAALLSTAASLFWLWTGGAYLLSSAAWKALLLGGFAGALLALMYEVVFLSVEKALDTKVLQQIDRERLQAEVNVLKNELDPHFFFNCMNTLLHLVRNDADKAYQFVHKLSSIYKYFLRNKEVDYVLLQDELSFLEDYYYLLRIRFDEGIRIDNAIPQLNGSTYILPCTLQILVENAMKHNFFSEKEPLVVSVAMNHSHVVVSNPVRPKLQVPDSTKVGLRNLKARYRLITNQNVLVQKTPTRFLVKLPIVKQTSRYDKNSDH